jgi:putative spermidine/putrescine transport system substrate-binding protein
VIPADLLAKMPPASAYAKAVFPTLDQQNKANTYIAANWDKVVTVEVMKR